MLIKDVFYYLPVTMLQIFLLWSVAELLDAIKLDNRILNGLEFPMQDALLDHTAYTSDLAA